MAAWNYGKGKCVVWLREHVEHTGDDCLIWPYGRCNGYGIFGLRGQVLYAHRYMCEVVHGAPPSQKHHAAHSCGNGHIGCVNPNHLRWKTARANQLDRAKDGRKNNGPVGKLTQQKADEIRSLAGTMPQRVIAARYGISRSQVSWIVTGKCWPKKRKRRHPNDVRAALNPI